MTEAVKSFLSGWAGGVGILAVGHPFDTLKTIMQNAPPGTYRGAVDCLKQLVAKNGMFSVYTGVTAPMVSIGSVYAMYFVTYDTAERFVRYTKGYKPGENLSILDICLCGGSTGTFGSLLLGPAELIKVRQQTARSAGRDASLSSTLKEMWRTRALFRGLGATMLRDVPGSVAWFGAFEITKQHICHDPKKPTVAQALVAGGMGGMGMWSFAIPLDAIKTRVQAATGEKQLNLRGATRLIFRESGIRGFYRGIGPALLRAFPANAACFAAKEKTQALMNQYCP